MKKIHLLGLMSAMLLFFAACEEDPIGGGGLGTAPTIFLESGTDFISDDTEVAEGSTISVRVNATRGTAELNGLTVYENGDPVEPGRMTFAPVNGTSQVPASSTLVVVAPDTDGFVWDMTIQLNNIAGDSQNLTFELIDKDQLSDTYSVTVTTEDVIIMNMAPALTVVGTGSYETAPGQSASIGLEVAKGNNRLSSITVEELDNGVWVPVDASTVSLGSDQFDGNPYILPENYKDGFVESIFVTPGFFGFNNYRVFVTDEAGLSSDATAGEFLIRNGTEVSKTLVGILFNREGPTGTGGLDLDDGIGTGSADAIAEIRDEGSDFTLPTATNWLQQISAINGNTMRKVDPTALDGISFDDISLKEFIQSFYDNSAPLGTNADGNSVSGFVEVGDFFVVRSITTDYLIEVAEVNVTDGDNDDNYVLNIKY